MTQESDQLIAPRVCLLQMIGWATRSFPRCRGRWRLIRWLDRHDAWFDSLGWQEITVPNIGKIKVFPGEFIGRCLFLYGTYEDELADIFRRIIRPGDNVVDIGANIGFFTLLASRLCGAQGRVVSIEASPEIFEVLKHNVQINECANVSLHSCAVGAENGAIQFYLAPKENLGMGSLRPMHEDGVRKMVVPLRRLDDLEMLPQPIKLIKIDVEGAEPLVLKGACQLLERDRPFIALELTDEFSRQLGTSAQEAVELLKRYGYSLYQTDNGFKEIQNVCGTQINLFCVPGSHPNIRTILEH